MPRLLEVFLRFLRLGVSAFGGPIAHLGYFEREFVERARWLEREAFVEIVALCTVLPGPTSSQVGMLLGAKRAGPLGALAAWLAFTFPSAFVMAIVGTYVVPMFDVPLHYCATCFPPGFVAARTFLVAHPIAFAAIDGGISSLYFVALAVVLTAVYNLCRSILVTPFARAVAPLAFLIAITAFNYAPAFGWIALVVGGILGGAFARSPRLVDPHVGIRVDSRIGFAAFATLLIALVAVPFVAHSPLGTLFATTFRAGSLVFGGGHVVLAFLTPLIDVRAVFPGAFEIGYGVVQTLPGPLFTFASFLGAADVNVPHWLGAIVATVGIFLPSFLILPAALSLWSAVRGAPRAGGVLAGMNAAVVGLLAATFLLILVPAFDRGFPLVQIVAGLVALVLLNVARLPAWAVVGLVACGSAAYNALASALHFQAMLRLA